MERGEDVADEIPDADIRRQDLRFAIDSFRKQVTSDGSFIGDVRMSSTGGSQGNCVRGSFIVWF